MYISGLKLYQLPFFVYAFSDSSAENTRALFATYQTFVFWLKNVTKTKSFRLEPLLTNLPVSLVMYMTRPRHEIFHNVVCVTSKASDQPAHTLGLIRAFANHLNILCVLSY